jgi:hypothetical protein
MTKPALNNVVGNEIKHDEASQVIRKAPGCVEVETLAGLSVQARSLIETQSRAYFKSRKTGKQTAEKRSDVLNLARTAQDSTEPARSLSFESKKANLVSRLRQEHKARLHAEAKLRQLRTGIAVLAKRTEQSVLDDSATEYALLLLLEAAESRAMASKTALVEAERKLKAEQDAAGLMRSQAEADRNAWQLQERANVLLRKAEQKAQERLATETMASKAAAFKLQSEREMAVIAEQRAYAELQTAREVEIKLRAETKDLALINERLADMQQARHLSGQHFET